MLSLCNFINESLSNKQKDLIGQMFSSMFKNTKVSKEQLTAIFNNLDKEIILEISKYFSNNEQNDYLPYDPGEDMFINYEENKDRIISQISEYIQKNKI